MKLAFALAVLARVVGWLPLVVVRALGTLLGALAWALGIRRAHVVGAMERAGLAHARRSAAAMYRALGMSIFELLWMSGRAGPLASFADFDAPSRGLLERARAHGRGVVLAGSHTGNWEIAACRIAEESELLAVTKRLSVEGIHRFCERTRARRNVTAIPVDRPRAGGRRRGEEGARGERGERGERGQRGEGGGGGGHAVRRALATLRRGGTVAMMVDQVPMRRSHALVVDFLGAPALADRAPAAVAALAGAPLVLAAARRNPDGTHAMTVLAVHEPPRTPRARRAWVDEVTIDTTRALERFVRDHPSEWLWLHRRWATPAA